MEINPAALTAIRTMAGMSQAELSRRSGVSQGHISEIESGGKNASPKTIKQLAEALVVPMPALLRSVSQPEVVVG